MRRNGFFKLFFPSLLVLLHVTLGWVAAEEKNQEKEFSPEQQMELSKRALWQQWEELKHTLPFQPSQFVAGTIQCIDPNASPRVNKTVFAYYAGQGFQGIEFDLITHLGLAFVDAYADGSISHLPLTSYPNWYDAINAAHAQGVRVVLVARNANFNADTLSSIVRHPTYRLNLINNLLTDVQNHCLDGVSIDFENAYTSDRDYITLFMQELWVAFKNANPDYHISFATPAYDWGYDFHYPALAEVTDAFLMMQYVYYGSWSSYAGPQAPLQRSSGLSVIHSIQTEYLNYGIPSDKLVLLMPYYGYQWWVSGGANPAQPGAAVTGLYDTILINQNPFVNKTYDQTIDLRGQHFHYFSTGSTWVQGWSDDASSIGKKIDLVSEMNLQGVGMWRIEYGNGYSQLWNEIEQRLVSDCGEGFSGWAWYHSGTLYHQIGRQDGYDWSASVDLDPTGFLVYGPYDERFGQGLHEAWFLMMIDNNTANNDVVITLDVVTDYGQTVLARTDIRRKDFSSAYQWQWFILDFNDPCFGNVEARIYWHDRAYIKFGQLYIHH